MIPTNTVPEFFNFIPRFVESGHPDVPQVLTMLIGRPEHDVMTYQECIRFLGQLRVESAVNQIRKLYARPPSRSASPFFLNTCLQALAEIQGSTACAFFEEALGEATHPIVVTKLQSLMKSYCGK